MLRLSLAVFLAGLSFCPALGGGLDPADPSIELVRLSTFATGLFRTSSAEIPTYCPDTHRLFVVNAQSGGIDILDITRPELPVFVGALDVAGAVGGALDGIALGAVNSAAVHGGIMAVAVEAIPKTDNGHVAFYCTRTLAPMGHVEVGPLPDALTFSPDGRWVLVANEGESNATAEIDPEGSITLIDMADGIAGLTPAHVRHVGFSDWNEGGPRSGEVATLKAAGLRVSGRVTTSLSPRPSSRPATFAEDMEPEWIAVNATSTTAYVSLQENNAIAVVDIARGTITRIIPIGFKDHGLPGNEIDTSDRDGGVRLRTWSGLHGVPMPDTIAVVTLDGRDFLVTANEGDSRLRPEVPLPGDGVVAGQIFSDEATLAEAEALGWVLPGSRFESATGDADLGRLRLVRDLVEDHLDDSRRPTRLFAFGARSFSIYDAESGTLVWESGSDFERITAARYPNHFNASNHDNQADSRSRQKGPEPEGLAIGVVNDRTYAFIGLERMGGIMVYDITNPGDPCFVAYRNDRDLSQPVRLASGAANPEAGDLGPEGLLFIPAEGSPDGRPLLVVANEVSGTTTLYAVLERTESTTPGNPVTVFRPGDAP